MKIDQLLIDRAALRAMDPSYSRFNIEDAAENEAIRLLKSLHFSPKYGIERTAHAILSRIRFFQAASAKTL